MTLNITTITTIIIITITTTIIITTIKNIDRRYHQANTKLTGVVL